MKRKTNWKFGGLVGIGLLAAQITLALAQNGEANGDQPAATIASPMRDENVGRTHEVVGKIAVAGQPLVLVRPSEALGEWYIQEPAAVNDRGFFKAKVRFGSDKTPDGTQFQIAIIVIRSAEEAEFFRNKESLPAIPSVLAKSEVTSVTLRISAAGKSAEHASHSARLIQPEMNARVPSFTVVTGQLTTKGWPVVVVRSVDPTDSWWVQGPAKFNADGHSFTAEVRIGNEKTPSGKKFQLAVLTLTSAKEAAAFSPGLELTTLSPGLLRSEGVIVVLERTSSLTESNATQIVP